VELRRETVIRDRLIRGAGVTNLFFPDPKSVREDIPKIALDFGSEWPIGKPGHLVSTLWELSLPQPWSLLAALFVKTRGVVNSLVSPIEFLMALRELWDCLMAFQLKYSNGKGTCINISSPIGSVTLVARYRKLKLINIWR
jgi:hypothetical protein